MTDLKMESVANAPDRPARRARLGRVIERIGTHNFSLLIALAALIAIFGSLRPDVFFLLAQYPQYRSGDRDPRDSGDRPDDRHHLGRTRYFGRRRGRLVDGLHCAGGRMDRLPCP